MRSLLHITAAAAAILIAKLGTTGVLAHPGCFTPDETPTLTVELEFCELEEDGACCTPTQEADAIALFDLAVASAPGQSLSAECASYYKQVVCGPCSSYAGHLYEVLGAELGVEDGMTMKSFFCSELTTACAGQILFKTYLGQSYCGKHVGGGDDQLWSYPIDEEETTFTSSGLVKAFPNLSDEDDLPDDTIAMHMTPDGSKWWLAGQEGEIREVSSEEPSSSIQVVDIGVLEEFYRAFEEGLLDFAFDPFFDGDDGVPGNGLFYVSYTVDIDDGRINRLSKFKHISGDAGATLSSEEMLLESSPKSTSIHSGGWCGFKPSDYGTPGSHDLYWAVGDGGPQEDPLGVGKNLNTLLASIVRISVSDVMGYTIPSGNLDGGLQEICAKGFRNPYRCGFDSADDALYCGDVGHTKVESIDLVVCGNDYGWSRFEGSRCQSAQEDRIGGCSQLDRSDLVFPIFEYCHPDYDSSAAGEEEYTGGNDLCGSRTVVGNAVIGGYPYRGQRFSEVLTGALLFADVQKKNLYYLINEGNGEWVPGTIVSDGSASIISFAEGNDGEQYVITSDRIPHQLPCGDLCAITCLAQAETQPVYESLGCFADVSSDRALTLASSAACSEGQDLMSPAVCSSYCATIEGSTFFGVEFAYECFCGGDADDFDKHGSLDEAECATLCTGTPDEFCGGRNAIEVYSFSDGIPQTPSPLGIIPAPPIDGSDDDGNDDYFSLGCFVDSVSNRVLSSSFTLNNPANTIQSCAEQCTGSAYFGTEFGEECFCSADGDDPTELGMASSCGQACTGDSSQICGDRNAISVYQYVDTTNPGPTPSIGYDALGCYADLKSPRVFSGLTVDNIMMRAEHCAVLCEGNQYFGTQYGNECWCGAAGTDISVNGLGVCDFACSGDPGETCGGFFAFNAYEYIDGGSPTTMVDVGCYVDSKEARIMTLQTSSGDMTPEFCSDACSTTIYFGVQWGVECWCSDTKSFEALGEAMNCDYPCGGDASLNCGGYDAMRVYENTG